MPSLSAISFFVASLTAAVNAGKWDYVEVGDDWGKVNPVCSSGKEQSPIDINKNDVLLSNWLGLKKLGPYKNFVGPDAIPMYDKTYTIQADFPGGINGGTGSFEKTFPDGSTGTFKALQMHLHAPSEHSVNGYHYDLELHVVHLWADGSLGGVIGIFFDREKGGNKENPLVQQMISPKPTAKPGNVRDINLGDLIDNFDTSKFYSYDGSLTTPPCTEGVKWNVMMDVQPLSDAQFAYFQQAWIHEPEFHGHGNYRRPQPLNGRLVVASVVPKGWGKMEVWTGAEMITATAATTLAALAILNF